MAHPISPKPEQFATETERSYWHSAQDIAFRAGASLFERDGSSWLKTASGERLLCESADRFRFWYKTWLVLMDEYPKLSRLWVGGRADTKPGQIKDYTDT
jgi:hypothetical protein